MAPHRLWELPGVPVQGAVRQVCVWSVSLWQVAPSQCGLGPGSPAQERFGCGGVALLSGLLAKAQHGVEVSGWHFRFGVKDACDILGPPAGLG